MTKILLQAAQNIIQPIYVYMYVYTRFLQTNSVTKKQTNKCMAEI